LILSCLFTSEPIESDPIDAEYPQEAP
jgi:hypothetical protein